MSARKIRRTRPKKVALVLGGGGTRGLAHIGVLKVLAREEVPVDLIVATSMGSIVGVHYALGLTPDEIEMGMVETIRPAHSFLTPNARQNRMRSSLQRYLREVLFTDLNIPTMVMAVDMLSGREVVLQEGLVIPAVMASSAVPGAFPPVQIGDMQLADGGVIDSLATHVASDWGADIVIAVDVYPPLEQENPWGDPLSAIMGVDLGIFSNSNTRKPPGMVSSLWRSVRVMTWHLHEKRLDENPPDVYMHPNVDAYGSLNFTNLLGPIRAGEEEAMRHIDSIRRLVAKVEDDTGDVV